MKKTQRDAGRIQPFEIPENVQGVVSNIYAAAQEVYPDHLDSRTQYIRERLIEELSRAESAAAGRAQAQERELKQVIEDLQNTVVDQAQVVENQRRTIIGLWRDIRLYEEPREALVFAQTEIDNLRKKLAEARAPQADSKQAVEPLGWLVPKRNWLTGTTKFVYSERSTGHVSELPIYTSHQ